MQTERAIVSGSIHVGPMTKRKAQMLCMPGALSPRLYATGFRIVDDKGSKFHVVFRVTYGPVWGGWKCDVRDFVKRALRNIDSSASISWEDLKRTVVETREAS